MKNALWLLIFGLCSTFYLQRAPLSAQTQEKRREEVKALTNKDVVEMLTTGLPAEIVAAKIRTSKCNFDTSVAALNDLRAAKVPDSVILAMVEVPHEVPLVNDGRTRIFVTDSQSWETYGYSWFHGGGSINGSTGNGSFSQNGGSASGGGARPANRGNHQDVW